jgi:hypothetical protein
MVFLVFVHAYNLNESYLQPWTLTNEPLTLTGFTEYFFANGILRFRIPMLFIISGCLLAMNDVVAYKKRMQKKVKTLLYPYLIWSAFGLLITCIFEMFAYGKSIIAATSMVQIDNTRMLLHQYHWYEILARWIFFPVSYQLWFIRVLLIYNLSYPFLCWCVTHKTAKWILFSIALLLWISTAGFVLFEGEGLLFFSLGIWIQKTSFNIDVPNKWLKPRIWFIVFVSLCTVKTIIAFKANFDGVFVVLLLLHKLVVFSGLIVAWFGCNWLVKYWMNKKWFLHISAFGFMIYVLHAPIVVYINKIVSLHFKHFSYYRIVSFLIVPIVLIATSILIGYSLRKLMPKVYSIVTGGRGL